MTSRTTLKTRADAVLVALRRIVRAIDLHSKRLERDTGLTTAQVLVLRAIRSLGEVTTARISAEVTLSAATVTTILDRLESRGLVERYRSAKDRRIVHARLTDAGRQTLRRSPPLLDRQFLAAFKAMPEDEQARMLAALEAVATMMSRSAAPPRE